METACALYVQPGVTPSPGETRQVRTTTTLTDGMSSPGTSCGQAVDTAHLGDPTSTARRHSLRPRVSAQPRGCSPRGNSLPRQPSNVRDTFSSGDERAEAGKGRSVRGHADRNRPPWPGAAVTICMSYLTTGGPGKERRTNKPSPTRRIWKGLKETPVHMSHQPRRLLLAGLHLG